MAYCGGLSPTPPPPSGIKLTTSGAQLIGSSISAYVNNTGNVSGIWAANDAADSYSSTDCTNVVGDMAAIGLNACCAEIWYGVNNGSDTLSVIGFTGTQAGFQNVAKAAINNGLTFYLKVQLQPQDGSSRTSQWLPATYPGFGANLLNNLIAIINNVNASLSSGQVWGVVLTSEMDNLVNNAPASFWTNLVNGLVSAIPSLKVICNMPTSIGSAAGGFINGTWAQAPATYHNIWGTAGPQPLKTCGSCDAYVPTELNTDTPPVSATNCFNRMAVVGDAYGGDGFNINGQSWPAGLAGTSWLSEVQTYCNTYGYVFVDFEAGCPTDQPASGFGPCNPAAAVSSAAGVPASVAAYTGQANYLNATLQMATQNPKFYNLMLFEFYVTADINTYFNGLQDQAYNQKRGMLQRICNFTGANISVITARYSARGISFVTNSNV